MQYYDSIIDIVYLTYIICCIVKTRLAIRYILWQYAHVDTYKKLLKGLIFAKLKKSGFIAGRKKNEISERDQENSTVSVLSSHCLFASK